MSLYPIVIVTPHLQSAVERPGDGDALGLGLARRDGALKLVQVPVLLQLLHQALQKRKDMKEAIRPNGLMEDGAKKDIASDMGYQEWVPDVVTAFEACEVQVI